MSETNTTPETPKPSPLKKILYVVGLILATLGVNHLTFRVGYADAEVTLTDSSIVIAPITDTVKPVKPASVDTAKADTTKK